MKSFAAYKHEGHKWVTLATGEFYPDILEDACQLYLPVLEMFRQLVKTSGSSVGLLKKITDIQQSWMRIQLLRVFRKYVSPNTPVEMLKVKKNIDITCLEYGNQFRPIQEVQVALLGSMWDDYAKLENSWPDKIKVITLRMLPERITSAWLIQ